MVLAAFMTVPTKLKFLSYAIYHTVALGAGIFPSPGRHDLMVGGHHSYPNII